MKLPRVRGEEGWLSLLLYISISPLRGCISATSRRIKVVFPAPVSPIMAVLLPGVKSNEKLSKMSSPSSSYLIEVLVFVHYHNRSHLHTIYYSFIRLNSTMKMFSTQ